MLDDRGGWKAADTALWREHLHAATAYGRLCSARVAVELGYGIVADDGPSGRLGHWAIAGVPAEVMGAHSKWATEIDDATGTVAESSYRERAVAARRSRSAKRHEQVADLMARWRAEIEAGPYSVAGIAADVDRSHRLRITGDLDDRDLDRLAGQLLTPDGRLAADKAFCRRDVIVAAVPHLFGLDPMMVDRLVDRVLAHPDAVELEPFDGMRERVWVPRCVIDAELAIDEAAWSRHHARTPLPVAPVIVTVVVLDEAGMTDDHDLHRLLAQISAAQSKLVMVGDPRQLSAVGPGGALEALVGRFDGHVWQLTDNIRQTDLTEREALAELRHGDITRAVDWLARHDRITTGTDRAETIGAVIDGWLADTETGLDTVMLAWRRANVDALNQLARHAYAERGWLTGPEFTAPGGRRYRRGDRIVTLAPFAGLTVTSETGTIDHVHPDVGALTIRFDDGRHVLLPSAFIADDRLAHGYAVTVHRSQGATVDTTHYLEDGGGRELAYVALSRARHRSTVYTHADDLDTAIDDLTTSWTTERRQQWITDRTTPLVPTFVRGRVQMPGPGLDLL